MAADFESQSPEPEDAIRLGIIDTLKGDSWREVGTTTAWCWQQGCMLQWIPGSDRRIIWNEREGDRFVSRVFDTVSGESRTLPAAVYSLAPKGDRAIGTDFRRIDHMRPGYGYAGIPDPHRDLLAPENSGIHTVDLRSGGVAADPVDCGSGRPPLPPRRPVGGEALLQPPAVQSRRHPLRLPAPLAVRRRRLPDPHADRRGRRLRPARRRRLRAHVPTSSGAMPKPSSPGPGSRKRGRGSISTGTARRRWCRSPGSG